MASTTLLGFGVASKTLLGVGVASTTLFQSRSGWTRELAGREGVDRRPLSCRRYLSTRAPIDTIPDPLESSRGADANVMIGGRGAPVALLIDRANANVMIEPMPTFSFNKKTTFKKD